jgi:hypothetical protein
LGKMRNEPLQVLCRSYLSRLRHMAKKHGLSSWLSEMRRLNKQHKCSATEHEVDLLARLCNDERVQRGEIPLILGKSYRQCLTDGDFDEIRRKPPVGTYSKVF